MIELINVTKYYPTRLGPHYVFRDVNLALPRDRNIGVIGPNGAGKSTLLRLVAGIDVPSSGEIVRQGRVSWPMGLTAGLQPALTGRENARFACRIYGLDHRRMKAQLEKIGDIAGIGKYFDLPVETYSAGMRQRVGFAITISLDFDYYIFDEVGAGGDRAFTAMAQAMMRDRLEASRFILASHNLMEIRRLCQSAILIRQGTLTYFPKVADAIKAYSGEPATDYVKTAHHADKVQKLNQQFVNLKLRELHLGRVLEKQQGDAGKREDLLRRLSNTRDLLQSVTFELRAMREEPPKPEAWKSLDEQLAPGGRRPPAERRLAQLRRRVEQLKIDETRQQLNAEKATSSAKRGDFEARLKITRRNLEIAERELKSHQNEADRRQAGPPRNSQPSSP